MVASIAHSPVSVDDIERCVFNTGYRLLGDAHGFHIPKVNPLIQSDIDDILKTVFWPWWRISPNDGSDRQRRTTANHCA